MRAREATQRLAAGCDPNRHCARQLWSRARSAWAIRSLRARLYICGLVEAREVATDRHVGDGKLPPAVTAVPIRQRSAYAEKLGLRATAQCCVAQETSTLRPHSSITVHSDPLHPVAGD